MTQQEFYKKMLEIKNRYETDEDYGEEDAHMSIDSLMGKTLKELGFDEGVKVSEGISKWYS